MPVRFYMCIEMGKYAPIQYFGITSINWNRKINKIFKFLQPKLIQNETAFCGTEQALFNKKMDKFNHQSAYSKLTCTFTIKVQITSQKSTNSSVINSTILRIKNIETRHLAKLSRIHTSQHWRKEWYLSEKS